MALKLTARLTGALATGALLLGGCSTVHRAAGPLVAITIDDIPVHGPIPPGTTANEVNREMIAALREAKVTGVHAFLNGASTQSQPETLEAVQAWQAAGVPIANHGWSHRNLNEMTAGEFEQELVRNEPLLQRFAAGRDWRWFRFPFLAEGDDPQRRAAARAILLSRGYKIAGVTLDFSDWKWTAPYARCVERQDGGAISELEQMYLDAAGGHLQARDRLARALYGRPIRHVLLLHVSAFSARMMPRLIQLYRQAGVNFVPLATAQADPAYAQDMNPALPPESQFIGNRAASKGIVAAPEPDYTARLEAICR